MFVVPKRKYDEVAEQLEDSKAQLRLTRIDFKNVTSDINKHKQLYKESLEVNAKIERERQMLEKSNLLKQDTICRLEYKVEEIGELVDEEIETNKKLVKLIEKYEDKLSEREEKDIRRLENIARRSKKEKVRKKCENRIQKIKERQILLEV